MDPHNQVICRIMAGVHRHQLRIMDGAIPNRLIMVGVQLLLTRMVGDPVQAIHGAHLKTIAGTRQLNQIMYGGSHNKT